MGVFLHVIAISFSVGFLGCVNVDMNPRKGTYSERFFIPPAERLELAEKAIAGDKVALERLLLHYQVGEYNVEQLLFWARYGKSIGSPAAIKHLKALGGDSKK